MSALHLFLYCHEKPVRKTPARRIEESQYEKKRADEFREHSSRAGHWMPKLDSVEFLSGSRQVEAAQKNEHNRVSERRWPVTSWSC